MTVGDDMALCFRGGAGIWSGACFSAGVVLVDAAGVIVDGRVA